MMFNFGKKKPVALTEKLPPELEERLLEVFKQFVKEKEIEGDGQAVFLGEGSHEEFLDLEREEKGLKAWYKRLGL